MGFGSYFSMLRKILMRRYIERLQIGSSTKKLFPGWLANSGKLISTSKTVFQRPCGVFGSMVQIRSISDGLLTAVSRI